MRAAGSSPAYAGAVIDGTLLSFVLRLKPATTAGTSKSAAE